MGAVFSRWKAKPSTVELLEGLDKDIKDLEEFRSKNQRLLKLWVGRLLFYSSILYLLTCLCVYYCYLPDRWSSRLVMALPLLAFPVLVWFMRKLLIFLFSKRTDKNNDKLEDLKTEKRKILEAMMETETYRNAKIILERFDPESKRRAEAEATPAGPPMTPRPGQDLRQRHVGMATPPPGPRPVPRASPSGPPGGPPESVLSATATSAMASPHQQQLLRRSMSLSPYTPPPGAGLHPPGPPLARLILPRERGAVDRVIEYLVGDGPQNRYALICQQCFSHNGMALREEFEYVAFRCAYCYFLNPARKHRPQAPRLPEFSFERRLRSESPGPESSAASHTPEDRDTAAEVECNGGRVLSASSSPLSTAATPWSKVQVHSFSRVQHPHTDDVAPEGPADQQAPPTDEAPPIQETPLEEESETSCRSPSPSQNAPMEQSEGGEVESRGQEEEESN